MRMQQRVLVLGVCLLTLVRGQIHIGGSAVSANAGGGLEVAVSAPRECVKDIGSYSVPGKNCLDILERHCEDDPPSGIYHLELPTKRIVATYCDMDFEDGGWTRILVCGPHESWDTFQKSDFEAAVKEVHLVAANASQIHIRSYRDSEKSVTSRKHSAPIERLRKGLALNDPHIPAKEFMSDWYGPMKSHLYWDYRSGERAKIEQWPKVVYWAMNNGNGLHLINDVGVVRDGNMWCHWSFNDNNLIGPSGDTEAIGGADAPRTRRQELEALAKKRKGAKGGSKSGGDTKSDSITKAKRKKNPNKKKSPWEAGRSAKSLELFVR